MLENEPAIGLTNTALVFEPVEEFVEVVGSAHDCPDAKVNGSGEVETLDDPVIEDDLTQQCFVGPVFAPDIDRRFNRSPEFRVIEFRMDTADDALVDESAYSRTSRVGAEADRLANLALGQSSVFLQQTENISVNVVDHGD